MPTGGHGDPRGKKNSDKDNTVAKAAGFVVFSGIAISILKTLNPFNNNNISSSCISSSSSSKSCEPTPPFLESKCPPPPEPIKPVRSQEQELPWSSCQTIEIARGDTLWGLSRKYGVSIDAIKEANGFTRDTIYAGEKLVIPDP
ncbi:PREDICTED: uncharacterized protein LOC104589729 isoform X2 [Nelumbo nucifera]|uniref:Uncharacterized protein LOC104589729 isoform X2 n=1 Tax=Nelumbo nucifera TaxID=4432 RepID=A0A1U7Z2U7_NELNU|nr:PREDICTED: uncharacterized protein LOC104589729 isoform X2 [Nelumbo nucifera]